MQSGDKKTATGVVLGLAAGGVYMTGPLAFPWISAEIWQVFFWLMVVILAISSVYFILVHTIKEDCAMPISFMIVGSVLFFAGAIWLGIRNDQTLRNAGEIVSKSVPSDIAIAIPSIILSTPRGFTLNVHLDNRGLPSTIKAMELQVSSNNTIVRTFAPRYLKTMPYFTVRPGGLPNNYREQRQNLAIEPLAQGAAIDAWLSYTTSDVGDEEQNSISKPGTLFRIKGEDVYGKELVAEYRNP
jgi:hypothetical protein